MPLDERRGAVTCVGAPWCDMISRSITTRFEEDYPAIYDLNRRSFSHDDDTGLEEPRRSIVYPPRFWPGSRNPGE